MKTAIRNINTDIRGYYKKNWQSLRKFNDACKIKCDLKAGTLLVICEHPANLVIDREKTISQLKEYRSKTTTRIY